MYYALWWDEGSDGSSWEVYNDKLTPVQGESIIKATINGLSSGVNYSFKYQS